MTDKKNGNAFTNNPLVKAVGTQKIVVLLVIIVLFAFFSIMGIGMCLVRNKNKIGRE